MVSWKKTQVQSRYKNGFSDNFYPVVDSALKGHSCEKVRLAIETIV
jgi:hypothetical protein